MENWFTIILNFFVTILANIFGLILTIISFFVLVGLFMFLSPFLVGIFLYNLIIKDLTFQEAIEIMTETIKVIFN